VSFFPFLLLGILAAVVAKLILKRKVGWFLTLVLGILGAALGSWIGNLVTGNTDLFGTAGFFNPLTWLFAIAGAVIVLAVQGAIFGRKAS